MVDKFQTILERIIRERNSVVFFGIFKMDELTDKWSVLLAANWLSDNNRDEGFAYVKDLMTEVLTIEERSQIARIGIFPVTEHLIELFLNYRAGFRIQEQQINGNIIHDGFVLASNR